MEEIDKARIDVLKAEVRQKQLHITKLSGGSVTDLDLREAQAKLFEAQANEKLAQSVELLKEGK